MCYMLFAEQLAEVGRLWLLLSLQLNPPAEAISACFSLPKRARKYQTHVVEVFIM